MATSSPLVPRQIVPEAGDLKVTPPTFLEQWGITFLAFAGAWILIIGTVLLTYYLKHLPSLPLETGRSAADVRADIETHKLLLDQYRDSLTSLFDLLVTKTVLPVLTLLLGYMFGKSKTL